MSRLRCSGLRCFPRALLIGMLLVALRCEGGDRVSANAAFADGAPCTARSIACARGLSGPAAVPEHGLIFAVGCLVSGGRWYRMLRADGHPLLKGESPSEEIEQYAEGAPGGDFAVRTIHAARSMGLGEPFKKADLTRERIVVYRSADGANLGSVDTSDFALSQMSFALSPAGDQMALIGTSSVLFYAVGHSRP